MEQVAGSHFLLFISKTFIGGHMEQMNGDVQLFLYQTKSITTLHLIFKMLLFF